MCHVDAPPPTSLVNGSGGSLGAFTIIADNPSHTCFAEPDLDLRETEPYSRETLGSLQVLVNDPNTQCIAEVTNDVGHPPRYRPAYELQDGALERAGRVSGTVPPVMTGN